MQRMLWMIVCVVSLGVVAASAHQTAQGSNPSSSEGSQFAGTLELVTDLQGADCHAYLNDVLQSVRSNWLKQIPQEAKPPEMKSGKGAVEFTIMPNGKVSETKMAAQTGNAALDSAALKAVTSSQPFPPLPAQFHGPSLTLRFKFAYNPGKGAPSSNGNPPSD